MRDASFFQLSLSGLRNFLDDLRKPGADVPNVTNNGKSFLPGQASLSKSHMSVVHHIPSKGLLLTPHQDHITRLVATIEKPLPD